MWLSLFLFYVKCNSSSAVACTVCAAELFPVTENTTRSLPGVDHTILHLIISEAKQGSFAMHQQNKMLPPTVNRQAARASLKGTSEITLRNDLVVMPT